MADATSYIGRFAPSPTGPLHFGSLLSALASFLDARHHNGTWLVRIEDIDPPREVPGARDAILEALSCHGLNWDGSVLMQSERKDHHLASKDSLLAEANAYYCRCSRKDTQMHKGAYPGYCRELGLGPAPQHAVRLRIHEDTTTTFTDRLWGRLELRLLACADDFLIWRKDDWPAYHLALVLDDIAAGVTHVVRGHDLKTQTFRQLYLYQIFGQKPPVYCHHPLVAHPDGAKLSKQTFAKPVDVTQPTANLKAALKALNQPVPSADTPVAILAEAARNWQPDRLPRTENLAL